MFKFLLFQFILFSPFFIFILSFLTFIHGLKNLKAQLINFGICQEFGAHNFQTFFHRCNLISDDFGVVFTFGGIPEHDNELFGEFLGLEGVA